MRDFVFEEHECMASIRLAELTKAVEKIRLGRSVTGSTLGAYGLEAERDAPCRKDVIVIYRVSDKEPVCLVELPDKGDPKLTLPGLDWNIS